MNTKSFITIALKVYNHPGVMSHIAGLFARRAYNLEGIWCRQSSDHDISDIYLLVKKDHALEQIEKQLSKLYDVLSITIKEGVHQYWLNEPAVQAD